MVLGGVNGNLLLHRDTFYIAMMVHGFNLMPDIQ
jgi:hypothetical protein